MPRLIRIEKGKKRSEWPVQGKEMLIGRGSDCDVRLNDPSVSRHHAKVQKIQNGYCVEDLNSTNGVVLNGRKVTRKHMLKGGDSMWIGNYELRFDAATGEEADDEFEQTAPPLSDDSQRRRIAAPPPSEQAGGAYVRFLSGPDQGNSKRLERTLFTIGVPGGNLAVISRRAQGYFLMHLGGDFITTRNDEPVYGAGVELVEGDVVQVGDIQLEFHNEP